MFASLLSVLMLAVSAVTGHGPAHVHCAVSFRDSSSWSKYAPIACNDLVGPARTLAGYEARHANEVSSTVLTVRARAGYDLRIRYTPAS